MNWHALTLSVMLAVAILVIANLVGFTALVYYRYRTQLTWMKKLLVDTNVPDWFLSSEDRNYLLKASIAYTLQQTCRGTWVQCTWDQAGRIRQRYGKALLDRHL